MRTFILVIFLGVFPTCAVELECLLDKVDPSVSSKVVELPQEKDGCVLDRIYTAGCYVSLSYVYSKFHSDTEETITQKDILKLLYLHREDFVEVCDNKKTPNIGAIVIPLDQKVIIIFLGTNFSKKAEILVNFDSDLMPCLYAPGLYHTGFLKLGNAIIPEVVNVLKNHYGEDFSSRCELSVYGHSMGGAIAQLLTQYLQHTYTGLDIETIIFGSPKVMCPVAAEAYRLKNNHRTIRVENPLDFVVWLPTMFMGYGVVTDAMVLMSLYINIIHNHEMGGYLKSIDRLRQYFRSRGIKKLKALNYIRMRAKLGCIFLWMSACVKDVAFQKGGTIGFVMSLLGRGVSKFIYSLIAFLM